MSECLAPKHGTEYRRYAQGCICPLAIPPRPADEAVVYRRLRGEHLPLGPGERRLAVAVLTRSGASANEIAYRVGITQRSAHRIRARLRAQTAA